MAANFGKFFGRIKKTPKLKNQANSLPDADSDDDDGYQDPSESCPTEPPGGARTFMPTYPPPRPNSPKVGAKNPHHPQVKKDDYQDPWDSKEPDRKTNNDVHTDYEDPFDSKFANQKRMEQKRASDAADDEYSEPYEPVKHSTFTPRDTYEDPWDTRKNVELNNQTHRTSSTTSKTVNIQNRQPIRRDDYSDPWDSKEASSFKSTEEDDDTYSDPYDTDKPTILDASNRRSVVDDDEAEDDDDLYDLPEDEKNTILGLPSKGSKASNFNSLPTSVRHAPYMPASRPPLTQKYSGQGSTNSQTATLQSQGDYDSPWEWQAKNVEEEFAKRFSMSDMPSPQPTAPPRKKTNVSPINKNTNINPVPKPARNTFKTEEGPRHYEIDPTIPIDNQGWFHGRIRRGDAEALLKALPDCSYLIRNSESSKLDYSLSLRNKGETMHLKISCRDGRYILGLNSRPYDTIPAMIHHYSMNKLNIRGAEHVKLQYPVMQENMYFTVEPGT